MRILEVREGKVRTCELELSPCTSSRPTRATSSQVQQPDAARKAILNMESREGAAEVEGDKVSTMPASPSPTTRRTSSKPLSHIFHAGVCTAG